jgi:hypothetical protein
MTAHSIRHRERAARDGEHLPAEPTRTELAHLRAAITLAEPNPMRAKSAGSGPVTGRETPLITLRDVPQSRARDRRR